MKRFVVNPIAAILLLLMSLPANTVAQEKGNMFSIDDEDLYVGINAGWVAKEWVTSSGGRTLHEDLWGNRDKFLHGLQIGLSLQKSVYKGIGFRTGLSYEWYISTSKYIKERGFSRFNEHGLYLPLHITFRMMPFRNFSIIPHAGFGFNWAIYGDFKSGPIGSTGSVFNGSSIGESIFFAVADGIINSRRRGYPYEYFDYNNHSPHHWNVQAEAGLALRFKMVELSFTYAWGLNRHWLYEDVPSHQNKLSANLSIVFSTD